MAAGTASPPLSELSGDSGASADPSGEAPIQEDRKTMTRRTLLAALLQKPGRLIIDTHLEVWTLDPRFPFHHPERPDVKVSMAAPIENQVAQMKDFGMK